MLQGKEGGLFTLTLSRNVSKAGCTVSSLTFVQKGMTRNTICISQKRVGGSLQDVICLCILTILLPSYAHKTDDDEKCFS